MIEDPLTTALVRNVARAASQRMGITQSVVTFNESGCYIFSFLESKSGTVCTRGYFCYPLPLGYEWERELTDSIDFWLSEFYDYLSFPEETT